MEEIRTDEGVKQEVNKLKTQVQRLNNIVWVVGIVAVVFGISGGFGIKMLLDVQTQLATLKGQASNIKENMDKKEKEVIKNVEKKEEEIKKDLQVKLNYDFDKKRSELDRHSDKYIKYGDEIKIRLKYDNLLLFGAYGNYKSQLRTIKRGEIPRHGKEDQAIWQIMRSTQK